ncbi:hypothetical protein EMPS_00959 [Entomortierella parvispora]|uniref:Biogenesis of lysosome-related organelles complex 1 subunit 5 n=1 Tax=Entomortierella parvispora TaxID=205924 RepID=A0A9P3H1Z0_9FUNG|nr:hypothetical protein EMPS_00959 [Entomortierella parvispora]
MNPAQSNDLQHVEKLCGRLLGQPQENVQQAIATFVQEFETKRDSLASTKATPTAMLKEAPNWLEGAKKQLDAHLDSTTSKANATLESLRRLQESIAQSNQKQKTANPTQLAKAAFQDDIGEAKEAFDQEMLLRHADVVKQYVGAFVQQIDHY